MRHWTILIVMLTLACTACQSDSNRPAAVLSTDPILHHALYTLSDDPVIQNAVDRHELAVIYIEADYRSAIHHADTPGQIQSLTIERAKQLNTLKVECLAALRQAQDTSTALNQPQKAAQIAALANRIATSPDNQRLTNTDYFGLHGPYQDIPSMTDWQNWRDWNDTEW